MVYTKIAVRNVCCKHLWYFANSPCSLRSGMGHTSNYGIRGVSNASGPVSWPVGAYLYAKPPLRRKETFSYKENYDVNRFLRHFCERIEPENIPTDTLGDVKKEYKNLKGKLKVPVGKSVIDVLQKHLRMTKTQALLMVQSPQMYLIPDAVILDTISLLKDLEIPKEQILRSPWVLLDTREELSSKIRMLTEPFLFENHIDGLGFCQFTRKGIAHYQNCFKAELQRFPNHRNRIYYIADELEIPVGDLVEKIVKVRRILTMDRVRIHMYIDLLKRYGIEPKNIVGDLWIFLNNIKKAEERLKAITAAGCSKPKLWMCRSSEEVFERTLSRYQADKDALGECTSLEDYLIKRLECTREGLQCQFEYDDSFKKISVAKIAKILDLLFANGFTPQTVSKNLRLLRYSGKRTAERLKFMQDMGVVSYPPSILYKSPRLFEKYYDCQTVKRSISDKNV